MQVILWTMQVLAYLLGLTPGIQCERSLQRSQACIFESCAAQQVSALYKELMIGSQAERYMTEWPDQAAALTPG